MKCKSRWLALTVCAALSACNAPLEEAQTVSAADEPSETGESALEIATSDNLMRLTCADFLATAEIAASEPADEAALAAQDELANGLTWLHGYLYATNGGEIDVLSQDWMKTTVRQVYERCDAAEDPSATNLFEVARS